MPQPLHFIALTIVTLGIITFFTCSNSIQYLPRQWQQTLSRSYAGDDAAYVAPLVGCDGPEEDIVKDNYHVFLHKGYSLDQHKTFVGSGVDFDSALRNIVNETVSQGLYYRATLDKDALAAVRADIGVDVVDCIGRAYPT